MCWQQIGYMMIIYIAKFAERAHRSDRNGPHRRATARQILFKIKVPMVMPSVTICTFWR